MLFTNPSIPIDQLPKAAELEMKPVEPDYLKVLLINRLILWAVLLAAIIAGSFFSIHFEPIWVKIVAGVSWVLFVIINWRLTVLSFRYKAYAIREHDIIYRSGWLIRSVRVCPFIRIQHCNVEAGVFERKYGLASLSVYTAGGAAADMKLPGLPADVAASMREFILSKTNPGKRERAVE